MVFAYRYFESNKVRSWGVDFLKEGDCLCGLWRNSLGGIEAPDIGVVGDSPVVERLPGDFGNRIPRIVGREGGPAARAGREGHASWGRWQIICATASTILWVMGSRDAAMCSRMRAASAAVSRVASSRA